MGDSVISVAFQGFAAAVGGKVSFSLLADSPLSEVVEKIEAQIQNQPCDIYDCTSSSTPSLVCLLKLDEKGTDAVTLQSLGWFPSANLIVVEKGAEISHSLIDDYWGGQRSKSSDELPPKIIDSKRQKVSEIMAAVENRVIEDTRVSPKKKSVKVLDWMAKVRRLDSIIDDSKGKKGSSSKKKKAVGEKVKQMLIKSKAKGEKRLREEDRFYFEVAVLEETEDDKHNSSIEYMFFSKQTSCGKICDAMMKSLGRSGVTTHFLVVAGEECRTVGNLTYVIDLERKNVIQQFCRVYIKVGDSDGIESLELE